MGTSKSLRSLSVSLKNRHNQIRTMLLSSRLVVSLRLLVRTTVIQDHSCATHEGTFPILVEPPRTTSDSGNPHQYALSRPVRLLLP